MIARTLVIARREFAAYFATPLAAVFLFFVRDLAGQLGGIAFAYMQVGVGRYAYVHICIHAEAYTCSTLYMYTCIYVYVCLCRRSVLPLPS
jgi:hypothetical protein